MVLTRPELTYHQHAYQHNPTPAGPSYIHSQGQKISPSLQAILQTIPTY